MSFWMIAKETDVSVLLGETLAALTTDKDKVPQNVADSIENDFIYFETQSGRKFILTHDQDCCESVTIEDICGNLSALVDYPLLVSELVESESYQKDDEYGDPQEWSFYKFGTVKGYVTVRWYGTSNGYYSTSVDFYELV